MRGLTNFIVTFSVLIFFVLKNIFITKYYIEMKKTVLFLVSLFVMSSCSHDIETYTYEQQQKSNFTQKFVSEFGKPAANQDWGFESVTPVDLTSLNKAATRGHNVNRNEWANSFVIPPNVTADEETAVLGELAKGSGNRDKNITINWADFFVYHVHKGVDAYNDHYGNSIGIASDKMNHLQCGSGTVGVNGVQNDFWEHINDFNGGTQNANWWTIEGATLMLNSSSLNFAYHNSTDSKYHDTYTVIDGANVWVPVDGHPTAKHNFKGYYYICFDFLANGDIEQPANKNMGVDRNYNYTDWIVRVSPAEFKAAKRIVAEDLAASVSDFDYNDVVFDATITKEQIPSMNWAHKYVAHITIRAAGGTKPLFVGCREVHQLFGVETKTMVNTKPDEHEKYPVVSFTEILGDANWDIKDIPVTVMTENGLIKLESNVGEPSEKLCVSTAYQWCDEREPIQEKYPDFKRYVTDKNIQWYQVQ